MHNPEHYADHTITTLCVSATDRKQWDLFLHASLFLYMCWKPSWTRCLAEGLSAVAPWWPPGGPLPSLRPHGLMDLDPSIMTIAAKNQGASRLNMDNTVLYNSRMSVVAVFLLSKWWWRVWGGSQFLTSSVLLFMKRSSLFSCLFCLRAFYFGINDA